MHEPTSTEDRQWLVQVDVRDLAVVVAWLEELNPTYEPPELTGLRHLQSVLHEARVPLLQERARNGDPDDACQGCGMGRLEEDYHTITDRQVELFAARYADAADGMLVSGSYHGRCCPWCTLNMAEEVEGGNGDGTGVLQEGTAGGDD